MKEFFYEVIDQTEFIDEIKDFGNLFQSLSELSLKLNIRVVVYHEDLSKDTYSYEEYSSPMIVYIFKNYGGWYCCLKPMEDNGKKIGQGPSCEKAWVGLASTLSLLSKNHYLYQKVHKKLDNYPTVIQNAYLTLTQKNSQMKKSNFLIDYSKKMQKFEFQEGWSPNTFRTFGDLSSSLTNHEVNIEISYRFNQEQNSIPDIDVGIL